MAVVPVECRDMVRVTSSLLVILGLWLISPGRLGVLDAQSNPHDYYNALVARPELLRAFSLRDPAQLQTRANGGYANCNSCPLYVTYDPARDPDPRRQDAAKVVIPLDKVSLPNQVRLPMGTLDGHTYLITWDVWMGAEFDYNNTGIVNYKHFQFESDGGIWLETKSLFSQAKGSNLANVSTRSYQPGPNLTDNNPMEPTVGAFTMQPERWTRYWWFITQRANATDLVSLWVADELTDPVQILNQREVYVRQNNAGLFTVERFWLEYNTSSSWVQRAVGPLVSYVRNFVVLQDVASPTSLMQRPNAGTPLPPPTLPTAPSAPKNLRIVPPL